LPRSSRFDRVSEPLHAGTTFEEVSVELRAKHFVIAVSVTALDFAVAVLCGGVIWRASSGILWSRITLFFLAALWLLSLLHLWSRAFYELRDTVEVQNRELAPQAVTGSARPREVGDV
jgi:hypothetical protein